MPLKTSELVREQAALLCEEEAHHIAQTRGPYHRTQHAARYRITAAKIRGLMLDMTPEGDTAHRPGAPPLKTAEDLRREAAGLCDEAAAYFDQRITDHYDREQAISSFGYIAREIRSIPLHAPKNAANGTGAAGPLDLGQAGTASPTAAPTLRERVEGLAYRFWSLHPSELDPLPASSSWGGRGGKRAKYYADAMTDLMTDIARENAELRAEVARLGGLPPATPVMTRADEPSAEPGYDFWAVVGLRAGENAEGYVIEASPDCRARDIFVNGPALSDNGDDLAWTAGRPSGLYLIRMSPQGDEDNFALNVRAVTPLCAAASDVTRPVADQIADLVADLAHARNAMPPLGARVRVIESGRKGSITGIRYRVDLDGSRLSEAPAGPRRVLERAAFTVLALPVDPADDTSASGQATAEPVGPEPETTA